MKGGLSWKCREKSYQVFVTALVEQMEHEDIYQQVCFIFRTQLINKMILHHVQANPVSGFKRKGFCFNSSLIIRGRQPSFINLQASEPCEPRSEPCEPCESCEPCEPCESCEPTVKMLRIFICYNYIRMRTITRSTEPDEYGCNIKFLQRLHKPSLKTFFESTNENKTNGTWWIRSQY